VRGYCWGPSSSKGPQKHNLTMLSMYGLWTGIYLRIHDKSVHDEEHDRDEACCRSEVVHKEASAKLEKREPT
jgi:hypothetical protein